MSSDKLYKFLAFIILIVEFIMFFLLFGKIRNIALQNNLTEGFGSAYLILIIGILGVVALFVLAILATYKKDIEDKYSKTQINLEDNKSTNTEDVENKEAALDIELYLKKIVPRHNAKTDLIKYSEKILSNIAKEFDIVQGLLFVKEKESEKFNIAGKYAYFGDEEPKSFIYGETISGQVAKNKKALRLEEIPDNYVTILSGLGSSSPDHLIVIPIVVEENTIAIIELASFKEFTQNIIDLFEGMSDHIGKALLKF